MSCIDGNDPLHQAGPVLPRLTDGPIAPQTPGQDVPTPACGLLERPQLEGRADPLAPTREATTRPGRGTIVLSWRC